MTWRLMVILLACCFPTYSSWAQKQGAKTDRADSLHISRLLDEGRAGIINLEKTAADRYQRALKVLEQKKPPVLLDEHVEALSRLAVFYMYKGRHDSATFFYTRLRNLGLAARSELIVARSNLGFGNIAEYRSDYETSIEANMKALSYFESVNDTLGMAAASGNVGNSYIRLTEYQRAVSFLGRAVDLYTKKRLKRSVANNLSSLGRAYKGLGNRPKELELKLRAFTLFSEEGYKKGIATVAINLASFYTGDNNFQEARRYFDIALRNSWAIGDNGNIGTLYHLLAELEFKTNRPTAALFAVDSALFYTRKSGDRLTQVDALLLKSTLLSSNGDRVAAKALTDRALALKDSIYNLRMQDKVADMAVRYETQKKENQLALNLLEITRNRAKITTQEQALLINRLELDNKDQLLVNKRLDSVQNAQNIRALEKQSRIQSLELVNQSLKVKQRNFIIAGILVLIVGCGALAYSHVKRIRLWQKNLLQEQQLLQQELIGKAVIEAEERERCRIAGDLHDGVGQLFSAVRMNLNGLFDRVRPEREEDRFLAEKTMALVEESCKEVRALSHQMMPNMLLRSGIASDVKSFIEKLDSERLKVSLEAEGFRNRLESSVEIVLYRVIQETVNNVIKHAKATALDIKLYREASGIRTIVADNGTGFDTRLMNSFDGIGLKNIRARIEYLKGTVAYHSAPGEGTKVSVWVPVG